MNLEIIEKEHVLFVKGKINSSTVISFKNSLQAFLDKKEGLVLNLDQVSEINTNGLLVLYKFYKNSSLHNLRFQIQGKKRDKIYNEF